MKVTTALLVLLISPAAIAGDKVKNEEESRTITYKQRTEIDFEGVEVQGQLVRPQGTLVLERKRGHFNPLIKLRTDFDDEMHRSVNEIK